jgi:hypothetical protein
MGCISSAGPFLGTFLGKQKGTKKKEDALISKLLVSYTGKLPAYRNSFVLYPHPHCIKTVR